MKCLRRVRVPGQFSLAGHTGVNTFHFSGRLRGRKLRLGRYILIATPTAGGRPGRAASAAFRIIK